MMAAFIFGWDYEKTRAGIWKMVRKGLLTCHKTKVSLHEVGVKDEMVFTARALKVKEDWLQHDTMVHKWKLTVPNAVVFIGYDCNPAFKADSEGVFSDGTQFVAEMDMETVSLSDVMRRLAVHKLHDRLILFMTLSEARIKKLQVRVDDPEITKRIWFGVWYDVMKDSMAWQDINGDRPTEPVYPRDG